MADITITAANVAVLSADTRVYSGKIGEAMTAGQLCYLDSSDSKYKLSDASAAATARVQSVCLLGGSADAYGVFMDFADEYVTGGTMGSAGTQYVLSATAGAMCLLSDLTSGDYIVTVGYSTSSTQLKPQVAATGIQVA